VELPKSILAGTAGLYLAERLTSLGLNFIFLAAIARNYGPLEFGVYAYAWSLTQFVMVLLTAGTESVLVREFVRTPGDAATILGSASIMVFGASLIGGLMLAIIYLTSGGGTEQPVNAVGGTLLLALVPTSLMVVEQSLRSLQKAGTILRIRLAAALSTAVLKGSLVALHAPLPAVAIGFACEFWVLGLLYIGYASRQGFGLRTWRFGWDRFKSILRQFLPSALAMFIITIFVRTNYLVIPKYRGYEVLGYYALAMNFIQVFETLLGVIVSSAYPSIRRRGARPRCRRGIPATRRRSRRRRRSTSSRSA